ncbi:MAG: septation protein IspZ [Gammaproteobacteria bacterium]|nr:septation protein IspZ [Gammaproteobacteria bacterium]
MKLIFEFVPLLAFFVALVKADLYVATLVFLIALPLQMACSWVWTKRIEKIQIIVLVIAILLGGTTLILRDPLFIKWKPTVVNWLFTCIFLGGQWFTKNPPIKRLLGKQLQLPPTVWSTLNISWAVFFFLLGLANLYFAYQFDTLTWAKFKVFGSLGLTLLFVAGQALFLAHFCRVDKVSEASGPPTQVTSSPPTQSDEPSDA